MLLRGDSRWRRRVWAIALGSSAIACIGFSGGAAASTVRHYEQVSPAVKGHADIVGDGLTTVSSQSGDAVAFNSRAQFAGAVGSGVSGQTQYVAHRSGTGTWSTHAITPMPRTDAVQTLFTATKLQVFSSDLTTALLWGYELPGATGAQPDRNSMYVEDTDTRALQPVTVSQQDPLFLFDFLSEQVWGVSDDARHVAFATNTRLLPDARPFTSNLYQWDDGVLTMAGVLPDGTVPSGGAATFPSGFASPRNFRDAMSADGSRLAFTSPANDPSTAQVYLRIDGRTTHLVSKPEGADQSAATQVLLQGLTRDGQNVFFVTDSPLTVDDDNTGPDLYRYTDSPDPDNDAGNLTRISEDGDTPGDALGASVVGFSEDGQIVYYHTQSDKLVVWDHGRRTVITSSVTRSGTFAFRLTLTASEPGYGRVTPDGKYMAVLVSDAPDNVHGPTGEETNGFYEMYLYSLSDRTFRCVSCPSEGATSSVSIQPAVTEGNPTIENVAFRPHFLSDTGRVFFSTAEALLPQDTNAVQDTYEFDGATGELSLLSTGTGRSPAMFADASASGDDVFIVTRQALATSDQDNLVDLYDVRVGAASPEPEHHDPVVCDGEGCQAPPSVAPGEDSVGSLLLEDDPSDSSSTKKALVARSSATLRGASGVLSVRITAPGKIQWSGKGLRSGSVKRSRAGKARLSLHLTRRARAQLRRSGRYVTSLKLTLRAADGTQERASVRLTFTKATGKGA